ncbi:MAG: zf-HC2 domain-containing protein [Pyrinomonadaceae bacterium]|nr:zf-HC2 domain-containing protein [Pyrinomonadaceae bacterium]
MKCEKYLILIDDLVEGELDEQTSRQVNLHVFACQTCAAHYETLKREKEIFGHYLFDVEPANDLWEKFQTKLEKEAVKTSPSIKILAGFNGWKENISGFLNLSPALACAALTLLLGIGFVLFNLWANENAHKNDYRAGSRQNTSDVETKETVSLPANVDEKKNAVSPKNAVAKNKFSKPKSNPETAVKTVAVKETKIKKKAFSEIPKANSAELARLTEERQQIKQIRNLENEAAKQVEKVELLLRSFRNARSVEDDEAYDVAYEKEQARKLLGKNVRLRRSAETYGSLYTEEILSRVEPYLLDIANLDGKPSADKVRDIKERVKSQNIIASLQIY